MANPKTGSPGSQPYQLGPARHHSGPAPSPARQPCHPWRDVCDRVAPLTSGGGQAGFSHGGSSPCSRPPCPLPGGSRLHKAVWTEVSPARLQLRPRGQGHRDVTQPCHRRPSQPACKVFQLLYCRESAAGSGCTHNPGRLRRSHPHCPQAERGLGPALGDRTLCGQAPWVAGLCG